MLNSILRICAIAAAVALPSTGSAATITGEVFSGIGPFSSVQAAENAINASTATATFVSTGINYPAGGNVINSATTLAGFLGPDAGTIVGDGTAPITQTVFRFTGLIELEPGAQTFSVGSDDGFRLTVNGVRVAEHSGPRGFSTNTAVADPGSGFVPFELLFYENFGNSGVRATIDGAVIVAASIPLPAGLPLILAALLGLGLVGGKRRRKLALANPA